MDCDGLKFLLGLGGGFFFRSSEGEIAFMVFGAIGGRVAPESPADHYLKN